MLERLPNRAALIAAAACATIAASGCVPESEGEFALSGAQLHQECLAQVTTIRPEMFAVRERPDSIGVFMQTDFRRASLSDAVYFEVYQPEVVNAQLGQPVELAEPLELVQDDEEFDEAPVARGQVFFAESCPEINETFGLRGTVVFDELSTERGEMVRGTLVDGQVVSLREEAVVVDQITGSWSFGISQRRPFRNFPSYRDDIPRGPAP